MRVGRGVEEQEFLCARATAIGGGDSYPEPSSAFKDEVEASPRSQQIKANCRKEGRKRDANAGFARERAGEGRGWCTRHSVEKLHQAAFCKNAKGSVSRVALWDSKTWTSGAHPSDEQPPRLRQFGFDLKCK